MMFAARYPVAGSAGSVQQDEVFDCLVLPGREVLLFAPVPFDVDLAAIHVNVNAVVVGIGYAALHARRQSLGHRAALVQGQLSRGCGKHGCNAGVVLELDAAERSKLNGGVSIVTGRDAVTAHKGNAGGSGVAVDRHASADIDYSRRGL